MANQIMFNFFNQQDIAKFLALFVLVILAFMVGLHNLFWYYSERKNIELGLPTRPHEGDVRAEKSFGGYVAFHIHLNIRIKE